MGGRYQEEVFYNQEQKMQYLEDNAQNQRAALKRIFLASRLQEEQLGKDLCNFNREELLKLYSYINASSVSVLYNLHRLVVRYMDDVDPINKQKHYDETEGFSQEFLLRYCNRVALKKRILTRKQILEIISLPAFVNDMDRFIVLCIFEGIYGTGYCEILNLQAKDLKRNGNVYTADLCTGRTVEISDHLYFLGLNVAEDDKYMVKLLGRYTPVGLEKTNKIVRFWDRKGYEGDSKNRTVQTRLSRIFKNCGMEKQLSVKSIYNSGMIDYAQKVADKNNITLRECIEDINMFEKVYLRYGYALNKEEISRTSLHHIKHEVLQYLGE